MGAATVAGVYATGLLELADDNQSRSDVVADARTVLTALAQVPELCAVAGGSGLKREQSRELLKGCFAGKVAPELSTLFDLLLDRGRLGDARDILSEVIRLDDQQNGVLTVAVTTAVPLDSAGTTKLEAGLKRLHGDAISFDYHIDADLLAGIKIEVDGTVFDATASRQLAEMKSTILNAPLCGSWEE